MRDDQNSGAVALAFVSSDGEREIVIPKGSFIQPAACAIIGAVAEGRMNDDERKKLAREIARAHTEEQGRLSGTGCAVILLLMVVFAAVQVIW